MKRIEEDCLFYIPDMSYRKIDDYLVKAHDYGIMKVVQRSMKESNESKLNRKRAYKKFSEVGPSKEKPEGLVTCIKGQVLDT